MDNDDAQRLRRAAGSKSLDVLKDEIETKGWQVEQLDDLSETGKSPLQQAAWKGNLESVKYLLDTVKCDVNNYSKQKFSYGKTPIFFALTQSRREMVEYLLSRSDIKVAIVNNKGQSVLSLAASHGMPDTILNKIQEREKEDISDGGWWNFRETHSDGLEVSHHGLIRLCKHTV